MLNRLFLQIHRHVGLVTLAFPLVAGATGVLLCFETPLDALLNPTLFRAQGHKPACWSAWWGWPPWKWL